MIAQPSTPPPIQVRAILAGYALFLKYKRWFFTCWVILFMTVWTMGMTTSFTNGPCRDTRKTAQDRLFYCNISITTSAVFSVSSLENSRRATLFLARGKIHSDLGQIEAAREDFRYALIAAAKGKQFLFPEVLRQPHVAQLFAVMKLEPENSVAYETWVEIVFDLACLDNRKTTLANGSFCAAR